MGVSVATLGGKGNILVCVMLRLLEYYSGCLFLSSNRAANSIDAAIASRITVMLGYPPLNAEGRAKVWKNLVWNWLWHCHKTTITLQTIHEKLANSECLFFQDDYQELVNGYELNGRQIKNSIMLARALARECGMALFMTVLHLECDIALSMTVLHCENKPHTKCNTKLQKQTNKKIILRIHD